MAMVRSSLKGMWNLSCEGGTYLYTHLKMGASFMFQTWQRGLMCLLVLASLPFLSPLILVAMMVGGVLLVPVLCGVLAYYALFHPASLSNITKWFRSPKSVLRSEPRSTELVMEDLDFHGVGNRNRGDSLGLSNLDQESIDQGREPKNEENKAVALIESTQDDEAPFSRVSAREGSTKDIEVEPQQKGSVVDFSFETPSAVESNQQLGGYEDEDAQGEELIPGGNERGQEREDSTFSASSYSEAVKGGSTHEIESVDTAPDNSLPFEETLGNEAILEEVNKDVADFSNAGRAPEQEGSALGVPSIKELAVDEETMKYKDVVLYDRDKKGQEEENRPSDSLLSEELVEAKFPLEKIGEHSTDDSYPVVENQDLKSEEAKYNAFHFGDQKRDQGIDQSMSLESSDKSFLEDEFPIPEITASGIPLEELNLTTDRKEPSQVGTTEAQFASEDSKALGEPEHSVESEAVKEKEDGHLVDRKQERFDEYKAEYKESGQAVSVSTQPLLSEGYLEHSEDELPLKDAVQQVDDTPAVEGESEPNYESAADSFSHSDYEQEQVDVVQTDARKLNEGTDHGLEGDTELYLKGFDAKQDVRVDEVDAPVVQEVQLPVSQPLLEKEVLGVEAEAVAAPAKPAAPVTVEKPLLVEDVVPMAGVASVGVAALVDEAIANRTSEPAPQVIEEKELEAPAPAPEVLKGVEAPVAEDASMLEREVTKKSDADPFALQVVTEDEAPTVEEKEIEVPLVVSEPVSEEKDVPLIEEDVPALSLDSEVSRMEQHSLPVDSEPVELAFPVADVPAIAEAAPAEVVASGAHSDANDLYVQRAPVVEKRVLKTAAPMKDAISERVEDSKAPVLAEKGVESSIEEAAGPESATSEASASIVETEATKEIDANLDEVSVELEKEKADPLLESTASIMEQHSPPVESEPVKLASSVEDVPAIAEAALVPEAASTTAAVSVREFDAKDVEVSEASIEEGKKADLLLESSASMIDQRSLPVESEPVELASSVEDIPAVAEAVPVQEAKSASASVEEFDAKDVEVSEAQLGEEQEKAGHVLESSASMMDQKSLPVDSEPVELGSSVEDIPAIAEAAPVQEAESASASVEEFDAKDVEVPEAQLCEEKEAGPVLESPSSTMDQKSLPVDSEPVELGSSVEDIPAIAEAAPVQEAESASASVEEFDAKDVEVPEAQLGEEKEETGPVLESPSSTMDQKSLPVDSEPVELGSSVEDISAIAEAAPLQEAESASASVEEFDAKDVEVPEAQMGIRKERDGPVLESSTSIPDQQSLPVDSEPVELGSSVEDIPSITEAAPVQEAEVAAVQEAESASGSVDEFDTKDVEVRTFPIGEEKEEVGPALESPSSTMDQKSLPVDSEPVELGSSVEDITAIAEAAPVQEAASVEAAALVEESYAKKVEEWEALVVKGREVETSIKDAGASDADALIVEPDVARGAVTESAVSASVAEKQSSSLPEKELISESISDERQGDAPASSLESEASAMEQYSLPVDSKSLEFTSPVADVPANEEAAPLEVSASAEETLAENAEDAVNPVVEEKEMKSPVAALEKVEVEQSPVVVAPAQEGAASEAEAPVTESEVIKDVAPAFIAAEEAPDVREVELPSAVSEPAPEEQEAPEMESVAVPDLEPEVPVVAEKSLPVQELQVEAAPVEESFLNKVREPEALVVENTEGADDTALHISSQVDSGASSEATTVELISPLDKDIIDGFKSQEHGSEDITTSEANRESGSGERHDRIASDSEPPLNVEDSMAVDENLNQSFKDRSVKVSDMELENASSIAQLGEQGHEAAQKLEENSEKDKVMESHAEQDVFPTLKPLNVVQSKDSSHDEQVEESDSVSTRAPTQRRISFENVRADEEVKMGAPSSPSHRTGAEGTNSNFVFKSHLGRDHRTHRHSAPDFLGTQTWVREAPFYSPQSSSRGHKKAKYKKWSDLDGGRPTRTLSAPFSDSTEAHMGEFESLLQSWQERDKATHSPTRVSPSNSPRSPAEIGRQIREEINTIQKIIGQDIPPQYSLWKEVETLCQIVGMELPYMGDVSDLTKARNGLDLLKVVVGIKWT